ncbi:MAG: hypothetical protein ACYC96_04795 [Fimbriimonadaceae bacterium]
MNRHLFLGLALAASAIAVAQFNPPGLTASSRAYHAYRLQETEPSYGLANVKRIVKAIKPPSDSDGAYAPSTKFNSLSLADKFTYCMLYGEDLSQNCNGMPAILGEESKLFAQIPGPWNEEQAWSERQNAFLHKYRPQIVKLLRATIRSKHRVGINLKKAIVELNAYELIPDMVAAYNPTEKDNDILSVFFLLMRAGKYKPFLASSTYKKLYADEDSSYKTFIYANAANKKLTIARAMAYYKSRKA